MFHSVGPERHVLAELVAIEPDFAAVIVTFHAQQRQHIVLSGEALHDEQPCATRGAGAGVNGVESATGGAGVGVNGVESATGGAGVGVNGVEGANGGAEWVSTALRVVVAARIFVSTALRVTVASPFTVSTALRVTVAARLAVSTALAVCLAARVVFFWAQKAPPGTSAGLYSKEFRRKGGRGYASDSTGVTSPPSSPLTASSTGCASAEPKRVSLCSRLAPSLPCLRPC